MSDLETVVARFADQIAAAVAERIVAAAEKTPARELLDEPAMAERLGISQPTLRRQRAAGNVPFVRLGRRVLYSPSAVDAALNNGVRGGQP